MRKVFPRLYYSPLSPETVILKRAKPCLAGEEIEFTFSWTVAIIDCNYKLICLNSCNYSVYFLRSPITESMLFVVGERHELILGGGS